MTRSYVGDVGTIVVVNCGCSIVGASNCKLKVRKPGGTLVIWTAVIYQQNYLKYVVQAGDLAQNGTYKLQASLTLGDWAGLGETAAFIIYRAYD